MSEMTVVQLVVAQREKELRANRKPGVQDWLELPCVCVIGACLILWSLVAAATIALSGLFRQSAKEEMDHAKGEQ